MAKLLTTLLALLLLTASAYAAEMTDDDYVTHSFGTVAVLHTPRQVIDPNSGWWGDLASKDLTNTSYLIGIINSRRMDKKLQPLLDPNDANTIVIESEATDANGYTYSISFAGMRPSEVQALVELLGGAAKLLPGSTGVTYEPLQRRWISGASYDGKPFTIMVGNQKIDTPAAVDFSDLHGKVDKALQGMFGKTVPFDFTLTRSVLMDGSNSTDISIYVDLNPPAPSSEEGLNEEDGE
jgi:hypothetical protein